MLAKSANFTNCEKLHSFVDLLLGEWIVSHESCFWSLALSKLRRMRGLDARTTSRSSNARLAAAISCNGVCEFVNDYVLYLVKCWAGTRAEHLPLEQQKRREILTYLILTGHWIIMNDPRFRFHENVFECASSQICLNGCSNGISPNYHSLNAR